MRKIQDSGNRGQIDSLRESRGVPAPAQPESGSEDDSLRIGVKHEHPNRPLEDGTGCVPDHPCRFVSPVGTRGVS